jgi:hypothetical protein
MIIAFELMPLYTSVTELTLLVFIITISRTALFKLYTSLLIQSPNFFEFRNNNVIIQSKAIISLTFNPNLRAVDNRNTKTQVCF